MSTPSIIEYKTKKKQIVIFIAVLSFLGLLITAALMHIGAGDAEWAGMSVSNITPSIAMEHNIPKEEVGVVVNWCESPSYDAGVRTGDVLKGINNKKIKNLSDFLNVTKVTNIADGALLDVSRQGQPLYITMENKVGVHDVLKQAIGLDKPVAQVQTETVGIGNGAASVPTPGFVTEPGMTQVAFANRSPAETTEARALNPANTQRAPSGQNLPSPKEQNAAQKELIEGHWLGLEVIPITPELATEFKLAPDAKGILVDEISLESAESGILAGDVVLAVERISTPDILAFTEATRRVKNEHKAKVLVSRRGQLFEFTITSLRTLGFSQNEAAQPITPGALPPHRNRNKPCTTCHIIMVTGGQLPTDAGDILPNPPPITKAAVAPHEFRGKCKTCHIILKK
ncbi:MAG: PDZ domain-containing protein [Candidatus Omnitrophica bacterium]|nr:PDZ domain-containing protein [Candidatus Omnitrophota bacterium]